MGGRHQHETAAVPSVFDDRIFPHVHFGKGDGPVFPTDSDRFQSHGGPESVPDHQQPDEPVRVYERGEPGFYGRCGVGHHRGYF